jgi:cell wall-associated NlpC family hydrolase
VAAYRLIAVTEAATRALRGPVRRLIAILVPVALIVAGAAGFALGSASRASAYRQALAGAKASAILKSAFPSASVTATRGRTVRVLVAVTTGAVIIEGQTAMTLTDQAPGGAVLSVAAHHRIQVTAVLTGGAVSGMTLEDLDALTPSPVAATGPLRFVTSTSLRLDRPVALRYHGALQVRAGYRNRLMVINDVSAEAYTDGVLAGQIPATWGPRALQAVIAGAIAVRSRAVAATMHPVGPYYDAVSDAPLYLGIDGERASTNRATALSAGKVLTRRGVVLSVGFTGIQPILFLPRPGHSDFVASGRAVAIVGARPNLAARALALARSRRGYPYVYGAAGPGAFDCSGLMYWIWDKTLGFRIPRVANDQSKVGSPVQRNDLQPGDLVFFADSSGYVTHVGMYIGSNRFIHAANPGSGVRIDSLTGNYFAQTYAGARRYSPNA